MAILQWVAALDTGIAEIDVQHRRIVAYINQLNALKGKPDRAGLAEVIAEAVDYTLSHFAFEEAMMESAGYVFAGPHKRVHELFTRKVAAMRNRFEAGEDVTVELHDMLSRWVFNHIRNEDHGYVESVQAYLGQAAHARVPNAGSAHGQARPRGWLARLLGR